MKIVPKLYQKTSVLKSEKNVFLEILNQKQIKINCPSSILNSICDPVGGGGDADVDDGEGFPNSIYTNSRSTASAAATGT